MTEIIDYIYALAYEYNGNECVFYVGRTIDPKRRIAEHRYGAKNYKEGDEDKYSYASFLNEFKIEWYMKILQECGEGTEHFEDFYVNKFRSEYLMNMKAGDDAPWNGRDYKTPEDYIKSRAKILEKINKKTAKAIKTQRVVDLTEEDVERYIFSFENPNNKFCSAGVAALRKK